VLTRGAPSLMTPGAVAGRRLAGRLLP